MMKYKLMLSLVLFLGGLTGSAVADDAAVVQKIPVKERWQEFYEKQKQDNEQFLEKAKNLSQEEKIEAYKERREKWARERRAFLQQMFETNESFLRRQITLSKMTETQKMDLVLFFGGQFDRGIYFRDGRYPESVAFFKKIVNDPNMSFDRKKLEIKAYTDALRIKEKARRRMERKERMQEKEKMRAQNALPQENDEGEDLE